MRSYDVKHTCPAEESGRFCDAPVLVSYDVGTSADEFYLVDDDVTCQSGHSVPHGILEQWTIEDSEEYAERMREEAEAARYYHLSGGR